MAAKNDQSLQSLSKFSADLYQKCIEKGGNVIVSPYSIAIALSLLSQGARGATFDEIMNGLHFSGDRDAIAREFDAWQTEFNECTDAKHLSTGYPGQPWKNEPVLLTIANKLYVKSGYELSPEFQSSVEKKFRSEVELLNFEDQQSAAATINDWVKEKTNGKFTDIISESDFDELTRLVMVNAIYFKGQWQKQFDEYTTEVEPFWINQTESIDVNMMHLTAQFMFGVFDELDAIGLEMGYKTHHYGDSTISFLILLPNTRIGLKQLEAKMKDANLADLTARMSRELVSVSLPKFRVEFEIDLNGPLQKLGISKVFNRKEADLGNLLTDEDPELHVSSVIHKAFIDVNEKGTEACGITISRLAGGGRAPTPPIPKDFVADHPFFYAIKSDGPSHLPLFWGSLRSPTGAIKNESNQVKNAWESCRVRLESELSEMIQAHLNKN